MFTGTCPICDATVSAPNTTEESEIISCPDCQSKLVVGKVANNTMQLTQAPEVEEDWGE